VLRKIRKFYWFMVITGLLFTFSAFNFTDFEKLMSGVELEDLNFNNFSLEGLSENDPQEPDYDLKAPVNPRKKQRQKNNYFENGYYVIDGSKYVQIDGKYYPYNENHVYYVDGQKIFFKDESRQWYQSPEERAADLKMQAENKKKQAKGPSIGGFKTYSASNIKWMMDTIKDAKNNIRKRNKVLEELSEQ